VTADDPKNRPRHILETIHPDSGLRDFIQKLPKTAQETSMARAGPTTRRKMLKLFIQKED